jgi:hypothetical protein
MEMMPLKSQQKRKNYQGHFGLIFKWINIFHYDMKYIWFVVNKIYLWWKESGITVNAGYFHKVLQVNRENYNPDEVHLPYSASREELLKYGHTIKTLPFHLLTKEERKALEEDVEAVQVTDEDRELFCKFLGDL